MDNEVVKVNGFDMYLDPEMQGISSALRKGGREPGFMWMIRQEAKGELGIDVGANIGYTTMPICQQMAKVIAIEPDKRAMQFLRKNISINGFDKKVTIHRFAVSDHKGKMTLLLHKKHPNLSTLHAKKKKYNYREKTISVRTIDGLQVLPNFIKMDIEGHEVEALDGAMECLRLTPFCTILMEVHPQYYDKKHSLANVLEKLFGIGFNFKYLESAGVAQPDKFKQAGYEPFKTFKDSRYERGLYKNVSKEDAVDFCAFKNKQAFSCVVRGEKVNKITNKIVRSICLVKE